MNDDCQVVWGARIELEHIFIQIIINGTQFIPPLRAGHPARSTRKSFRAGTDNLEQPNQVFGISVHVIVILCEMCQ
jgi:hypothetical protein